jgi:hypothetical protein
VVIQSPDKELGGVLTTLPANVPPAEKSQAPVGLSDLDLRDEALIGVGASLYLAASRQEFDGLSDAEFDIFRNQGVEGFRVLELIGKLGVPENMRLPTGFTEHFKNEVLPDLQIIREDPEKAARFREELSKVLHDRGSIKSLYREGGITYSQILTDVAGTKREGRFYGEGSRTSFKSRKEESRAKLR